MAETMPDAVEPELSGGTGIDGEQLIDRVVHDFEDVRMACDEELGPHGLDAGDGAGVVVKDSWATAPTTSTTEWTAAKVSD